ncbi:thymidine phosphorylase [Thermovibrio ammonificans]|uniref:thymidine phosphorylase n=1 Tax=Thermovibrio ammonificans (strain DSM 15698 / JCM 12110 / HB-1) TaxID=648996 RepID=E8T375_THEA1|nr:thymidine phosphorylase [Thermovibrio ammonificans]ADU96080.1 pyrimidine-nucleoside phosphorylase [Thermovibrio ammonificans HB-1]
MIFKELIKKKRDGGKLSRSEVEFVVESYTKGETPDYQMAAFLMAVFFRGLDHQETLAFTDAMLRSGERVNVEVEGTIVDKHSTGGIGDKVSLVIAPTLAELGFKAPLLAGRALGFTGGTIDKLESTGMKVELNPQEITEVTRRFGFSISAQTEEIAPADRKIYALRDATSTVESIPLIVSSILSKKLAVNTDAIVFDVKVGTGAFMKRMEEAEELAEGLVEVSKLYGKRAGALITEMSQPLGRFAGNALEVKEAIEALGGKPQEDLLEVTSSLVGLLFQLTGRGGFEEGKEKAIEVITSGRALKRFLSWIEFLGGDPDVKVAEKVVQVKAPVSGYVAQINGEALGYLIIELGGGRKRAGEPIDYSVGLGFRKKIGERVEKGEVIGEIYYSKGSPEEFVEKFLKAFTFTEGEVERPKLIKKRVV